jgi:hypothetical protein
MALHFRKLLELIAFASLVANKDVYSKIHADFFHHWSAKKLLANLERIHPAFYPRPVRPVRTQDNSAWVLRDRKRGFLDKNAFVQLYDICSMHMHVQNPFKRPTNPRGLSLSLNRWLDRIRSLVKVHLVEFADRGGIWLTDLGKPSNPDVQVYLVEESVPVSPPKKKS